MQGKGSYRPRRNRRKSEPGTPGGTVAGVNVCAFEFRADEGLANISVHVIGAGGEIQSANLLPEVGDQLPIAGITILNASSPGDTVIVTEAHVIAPGTVQITFLDLTPGQVGTILIPPMLAGWGDRTGRVFGGLYASIPAMV